MLDRQSRFERWEKLGVDRVKADLLNGGHQIVSGPPQVQDLAWEWVRLREAGQSPANPPAVQRGATQKRYYYVSYAWADESDPKREEKVDALCEDAKRRGIEITRDKTTLVHGELNSEFMRKIGEGGRLYIFLSDKYLHSPYCMSELFEMWRHSRQDKTEFLRRVATSCSKRSSALALKMRAKKQSNA